MKDTELLLTMLINLQYLQVKILAKLTEDNATLEEATMIVTESRKLLEQMIKEEKEEMQNEGIELKINTEEGAITFHFSCYNCHWNFSIYRNDYADIDKVERTLCK